MKQSSVAAASAATRAMARLRGALLALAWVSATTCGAWAAPEDGVLINRTMQAEFAEAAAQASPLWTSPAWARATPPGVSVAAVYVNVTNAGPSADTLLSASSPVAARVELHQSTVEDGMSRMRPVDGLELPPGKVLKIEPGGLHLMLTGLAQPLVAGTPLLLTLQFRKAGAITLQVDVIPLTAPGPVATHTHDHASHQH